MKFQHRSSGFPLETKATNVSFEEPEIIKQRAAETENRPGTLICSFPSALVQGRDDDATSLAGHKLSNFFTPPS
jgi:hypothetical protein